MTTFIQFQMRRDTTTNWTSANPVLGQGELGLDTTLNRFKIGDGTTAYNSLGYAPNTVFGGTGAPSGTLGVNGDIYFDTTTGATKLYGPKAAGSWGSGVTLTGATGAPGTPGTTGATGPGVVVGGTAHQALTKIDATNFNTQWETINPAFVGSPPVGRLINTTAPLTGGGDLSADRTLAISAATTGAAGSMSAVDKAKLDSLTVSGLTGWVDVTKFPSTPCLPGNTAAQNITAINAILAASAAGNTIYFPGGTYQFNAAWTMPAGKQFTFQGQGSGGTGGNTLLEWTANVAGDIISLPAGIWYWRFSDLNFCVASGVTQSAGALINIKGAAGTNFFNCTFSSIFGGFWNDVLYGDTPGAFPSNQSWNSAIVQNCVFSGYKGRGIYCDSAASSLVVTNSVIQGQWGPTTGTPAAASAVAGIEVQNCGALQINDCDILGNVNNLLSDPASGKVSASIFCTNTYFDSSAGSCIKISGVGATVRARFDTCSFTTAGTNFTTAGTNLSAVEISSTFNYLAGGQGLDFVNCNVLNTFFTTGTTNGYLISGAADFSIGNNRVAGWTNGVQITPKSSSGVTQPQINNNTIGASAGYGTNTTGIRLNAGTATYGSIVIESNVLEGNITPIVDGSTQTVPSVKKINGNPGWTSGQGAVNLNPSGGGTIITGRGAVTSGTTETLLFGTFIVGNSYAAGQVFRLKATGRSSSTGTLIFKLRAGTAGTVAGDTTVLWTSTTSAAQVANASTVVEAMVTATSTTGGIVGEGRVMAQAVLLGDAAAIAEPSFSPGGGVSWFFELTCTCSVGTFTVQQALIEAL